MPKEVPLLFELSLSQGTFHLTIEHRFEQQTLGIYGPSGSGKTSILEAIVGLRKATGTLQCGSAIWFDSKAGIHVPTQKRAIGYVPQDHLLFPHLNVRENLLFSKRGPRSFDTEQALDVDQVIDTLQLRPLLERRIQQLSGGEKQRVSLGRALCSNPHLLLLDEPMASLDTELRKRILPFLLLVKAQFQIPMIIVSHNPLELQLLCDEVIAINQGQVTTKGSPLEVFTHRSVYTDSAIMGFQNILIGQVTLQNGHETEVSLGAHSESGATIYLPPINCPVGTVVRLGLNPNHIMVSKQPLDGISARNQLPATLVNIEELSHCTLLHARFEVGQPPLIIELSETSIQNLALSIGSTLFVIFKRQAVEHLV